MAMARSSGAPSMALTSFWKCFGWTLRRDAEGVAERRDELLELVHLEDVRRLVDAEQRRRPVIGQVLRHRLVGEQHELLDQPVRDVPFRGQHR